VSQIRPYVDRLAARMLEAIVVWDRDLRHGSDPPISVHPNEAVPPGGVASGIDAVRLVLHGRHTTIVVTWPVPACGGDRSRAFGRAGHPKVCPEPDRHQDAAHRGRCYCRVHPSDRRSAFRLPAQRIRRGVGRGRYVHRTGCAPHWTGECRDTVRDPPPVARRPGGPPARPRCHAARQRRHAHPPRPGRRRSHHRSTRGSPEYLARRAPMSPLRRGQCCPEATVAA
jgi:hypothetical protein